jgi:bifunctional DNase/RNase
MIPVKVDKISYHSKSKSYAIILKEIEGDKCMPVIIGSFEAQSISLAIEEIETPRPLTHDLICDFISALDVSLKAIKIYSINEGVYFAKIIIISKRMGEKNIDARPSDAIAVALRMHAPILVSKKVFEKASVEEKLLFQEKERKKINKDPLPELKREMELAVEKEEYELAAELRDKINKLEVQ